MMILFFNHQNKQNKFVFACEKASTRENTQSRENVDGTSRASSCVKKDVPFLSSET